MPDPKTGQSLHQEYRGPRAESQGHISAGRRPAGRRGRMKSLEEATENSPGREPWDSKRELSLAPEGRQNVLDEPFVSPLWGWEVTGRADPGLAPWAIVLRPYGAWRGLITHGARKLSVARNRQGLISGRCTAAPSADLSGVYALSAPGGKRFGVGAGRP